MGIYRRGKVYWGRWSEGGKQHRKSLDTEDQGVAEERFEELLGQESPGLTMRHILRDWLEYQRKRCKPQTIQIYRIVRKRFAIFWGNLRPEEITPVKIKEAQDSMLRVGLSPRTINQQIDSGLSAIRWATDQGLIDVQPPRYKKLKLRNNHTRKYLTGDELRKLLVKVKEPRWERLELVVLLALYAGLRQGEIIWLTWEDVDLEEGWLHIRSKKGWSPKSSSSERSIPLAPELGEYLNSVLRDGYQWVAPHKPDKRWKRTWLANETRQLFKAAGVDNGGPHALHRLRGTFATTVLRGGGDLESLKDLLGHTLISVTAGYLSSTSESKQRAIAGLSFGK
jgi:integrase